MVAFNEVSPSIGDVKQQAPGRSEQRPSGPNVRLGRTGPAIMVSDAFSMLAGVIGSLVFGFGPNPSLGSIAVLFAGVGIALAVLSSGGSYRSRVHLSVLDELPDIGGRVLVAGAITELLASLLNAGSRFIVSYSIGAAFLLVGRATCYAIIHSARRRGVARHRTLVVGAGAVGSALAAELVDNSSYGLTPVAFFDPHPMSVPGRNESGIKLIRTGNVADAIWSTKATVVIVAFMSVREASLVSVIRQCDRMHTEILCVPRLFELSSDEGAQMDRIGSIPLLRLRRNANRSRAWIYKRAFDIVVASTALLFLGPLLAVLALGVVVFNGRPIFFSQERLSKDSEPFHILKFRSLPNASPDVTDADWNNVARQPNWYGRLLRKSSLDELPQLLNILRGDMSIVGPRPERPAFADQFSNNFPGYADRHRVPAGLTGLAQVEGLRGDTSIAKRAEFDNAYVERWSLWNDMKIILRTVKSVTKGEGK
ncbi:MAG: sugar transferase [Acidimicrobiales bacterium]|nr:sugar transferase [Acidimicrobiales bacterium]